MKKRWNTLWAIACITLLSTSLCSAQNGKYYYSYQEQIPLTEVSGKLVLGVSRDYVTEIKAKIGKHPEISATEWRTGTVCVMTVDSLQKEKIQKEFQNEKGVKSVQPLYSDKEFERCFIDEIVVKFKESVPQNNIDSLHILYGVKVKKVTKLYQVLTVSVHTDVLTIANLYQESGWVHYSQPNYLIEVSTNSIPPTDPYFANQFYLHNTGQTMPNGKTGTAGADINILPAWDITKGDSSIVVAVIDAGVTADHPDLPNSRQIRLPGSSFFEDNPDDPSPGGDENHGNACAGIIAASHNGEGIAGIAPLCKIMPIRILDSAGRYSVFPTTLAEAILFATENGADVISCSWSTGSETPIPVIEAIDDAIDNGRGGKGCLLVFSASNSADREGVYEDLRSMGAVSAPARLNKDGLLAVGASDRDDRVANYSPRSDANYITKHYPDHNPYEHCISLVAPSNKAFSCEIPTETREVWTIDIPDTAGYNPIKYPDMRINPFTDELIIGPLPVPGTILPDAGPNHLAYASDFCGTSAAAPQVAGVAALMLSKDPSLTAHDLQNIIEQTAQVFRDLLGGDLAGAVLEHHSNIFEDPDKAGGLADDNTPDGHSLAIENWDAPLVVTTSVQFFESLFAARSSQCRKLHNIAGSVIILDECQTLPAGLLQPTQAALKELAAACNCSILLCTATQPELAKKNWNPWGLEDVREIVPDPPSLFAVLKRVNIKHLGECEERYRPISQYRFAYVSL